MAWQMQDAKNRFSEVVRAANAVGPQVITVHGREAAVVLSAREYRGLCGVQEPLGTYLIETAPRDVEPELFERADDSGRDSGF